MKDGILNRIQLDEIELGTEETASSLRFMYRGWLVCARIEIESGSFELMLRVSMGGEAVFSGAFDERERGAWRKITDELRKLRETDRQERAAAALDALMS